MGREYAYAREASNTREAELYPTPSGQMFASHNGTFNFKTYGQLIYTMTYGEALALHTIMQSTGQKVTAVCTLKAFRPQLSLQQAGDIVSYLRENFKAL